MVIDLAAARVARGLPAFHGETETQQPVQAPASAKAAIPEDLRDICRDTAIARIRAALKKRTGRAWSVTGGTGTAWGWIKVHVPPRLRDQYGSMSDADRMELAAVLGFEDDRREVGRSGWSIPASSAYYRAAVQRAETGTTTENPQPYWD